ncbi:transcriptional regulator, partial [Pseudomonas aeruginosa]|nr:transcriptional regulator [Pseudomonas aeruginosa]
KKPLFDCQEIRGRCAVFGNAPPGWATGGTCAIHAVMLRAEKAMRDSLASQSLADVAHVVGRKAPPDFSNEVRDWLGERIKSRARKP